MSTFKYIWYYDEKDVLPDLCGVICGDDNSPCPRNYDRLFNFFYFGQQLRSLSDYYDNILDHWLQSWLDDYDHLLSISFTFDQRLTLQKKNFTLSIEFYWWKKNPLIK